MRLLIFTIGLSLFALVASFADPAISKEGVPGRRVGGGTRWTLPQPKQPVSLQSKLSAIAFASRTHLPLKLEPIYG